MSRAARPARPRYRFDPMAVRRQAPSGMVMCTRPPAMETLRPEDFADRDAFSKAWTERRRLDELNKGYVEVTTEEAATDGDVEDEDDRMNSQGYLIRVELPGKPCIVRVLRVPSAIHFHDLHRVIQAAVSHSGIMQYEFKFSTLAPSSQQETLRLGLPKSIDVTLAEFFEDPKWANGFRAGYGYGFPHPTKDLWQWRYTIQFMGVADDNLDKALGLRGPRGTGERVRVFCVSGQGSPVDEMIDGNQAWEKLKAKFQNPSVEDPWIRDPDAAAKGDEVCPWEPWAWDQDLINSRLAQLRF